MIFPQLEELCDATVKRKAWQKYIKQTNKQEKQQQKKRKHHTPQSLKNKPKQMQCEWED